jgi:hypothetical protein
MANEASYSVLLHTIAKLVGDAMDLVQREIALARAEITAKVVEQLESAAWLAVAGLLGFVVLLLIAQAAVFGLIAVGVAPAWACVLVAIAAAILAAAAFVHGRSPARATTRPSRSLHQINEDIRTIKEQLS